MAELTILTWLWSQPGGRSTYTAAHVNIWAAMVRRHLTLPHRIACVTDMPEGIDPSVAIIRPPRDFEDVRIPTWGEDRPQCLRRLAMFRPDADAIFGGRFVSMDLDCVIAGSLDPLFDRDDEIVLYRGASGRRPYNGSMVMMTAGVRPGVYEDFTPEAAAEAGERYLGSDQAWISHRLGAGEATWDVQDGITWHGASRRVDDPRLMFFFGNPKPWELAERNADAWVREHYRGDRRARCLILGHAPSVWQEAELALRDGGFDQVIASPEAARHWPTSTIVANDDGHAERIARMHGYSEIVFCGRSAA